MPTLLILLIFKVKFCITLEVSQILRQNLAEMWNNYIQMNWTNKYFWKLIYLFLFSKQKYSVKRVLDLYSCIRPPSDIMMRLWFAVIIACMINGIWCKNVMSIDSSALHWWFLNIDTLVPVVTCKTFIWISQVSWRISGLK
jgi:ABC-type bacteriocin/lantibiotic exporter with double-glycine peptidase domain